MIILPLAIDLRDKKIPTLTIWICFACIMIFFYQTQSREDYRQALKTYCQKIEGKQIYGLLKHIQPDLTKSHCYKIYLEVRRSENADIALVKLAEEAKPLGFLTDRKLETDYLHKKLKQGHQQFETDVPVNMTDQWIYLPTRIEFKRMFTASFSHSDWRHLLGNMLFFIIFGGAVEMMMGRAFFLTFIFCTCITTHVAYSYSVVSGFQEDMPSLGLSGVIAGMMALTGILLPGVRVTFFVWLFFFFSFFRLPAFFVALWYVYWDLYGMARYLNESCIGYVAHVSGAATGILFAALLLKILPRTIRELRHAVVP